MVKEIGTVTAIEQGALWVETSQRSGCSSCDAQKNCGQSALMNGLMGKASVSTTAMRVLLSEDETNDYLVDDKVVIGVPDHVVVGGTLLLYLLPLLTMIVGVIVANQWSGSDGATSLAGFIGLILGGGLVRYHSRKHINDPSIQPVVLGKSSA